MNRLIDHTDILNIASALLSHAESIGELREREAARVGEALYHLDGLRADLNACGAVEADVAVAEVIGRLQGQTAREQALTLCNLAASALSALYICTADEGSTEARLRKACSYAASVPDYLPAGELGSLARTALAAYRSA